jgi:hypothetical protein
MHMPAASVAAEDAQPRGDVTFSQWNPPPIDAGRVARDRRGMTQPREMPSNIQAGLAGWQRNAMPSGVARPLIRICCLCSAVSNLIVGAEIAIQFGRIFVIDEIFFRAPEN